MKEKMQGIDIFEEFQTRCRWAVDKVKSWETLDPYRILVYLDDGCIEYDAGLEVYRWARSPIALMNQDHPKNESEAKIIFGKKLYRYMYIKDLPQEYLAWKTDISSGCISRYINGISLPSIYNLTKIAKVLDLTKDELLDLISYYS